MQSPSQSQVPPSLSAYDVALDRHDSHFMIATINQLKLFIKNNDLSNVKLMFTSFGKQVLQKYWKKVDTNYYSPIHEAADYDCCEIFEYLIDEMHFDINELTSYGSHCIHMAAYHGKKAMLILLINKYQINPNMKTKDFGCNSLILASRNGYLNIVKYLIEECNCDINGQDSSGSSALHKAAGWNQPRVLEYLIENGADLELTRVEDGFTPLMVAVYYNKYTAVQLLLEYGSNIEQCSVMFTTPVSIALQRKSIKSLQILISFGADIDRVCNKCSVRKLAHYESKEIRKTVEHGINEFFDYYQETECSLNYVLNGNDMCCGWIVHLIMVYAYPTPVYFNGSVGDGHLNSNGKRTLSWKISDKLISRKRRRIKQ